MVVFRWLVVVAAAAALAFLGYRFMITPQFDANCFLAMDKMTGTFIGGYDDRSHICTRAYRWFGF